MNEKLPNSPSSQSNVSRRDFLKTAASAGLAGLAATPTAKALHTAFSETAASHVEHEAANPVDLQSATAVLAGFGYFVGYEGIVKGKSLGKLSAGTMLTLALGRTGLLQMQNDAHLKAEGAKERGEILEGIRNTGFLVALADAATHEQTGVRADAERIFQETADSVLDSPKWGSDRPALEAPRSEWIAYEQKLSQTITGFVAEITGFSGVMAPIATTFVSSSVSNQMKEKVAHATFELYFARAVCQQKAHGNAVDIGAAQITAKEATENAINGSLGFTNMLLATAANAQGSLILGGAPYIFTVGDNFADPKQFAANTVLGIANALAAPITLGTVWLASVGIVKKNINPILYIKRYVDTGRAGLKALGKKRAVSFGGGRAYVDGVIAALQQTDAAKAQALAEQTRSIPDAEIQFDIMEHVLQKGQALKAFFGMQTDANQQDPSALWNAFAQGDIAKLTQLLQPRVVGKDTKDAANLSTLLHDLKDGVATAATLKTDLPITSDSSSFKAGKRAALAAQALTQNVANDVDLNQLNIELDTTLSQQGTSTAAVKQALSTYTQIAGKEDVVPNEDVIHKSFLSHSAQEAAWALLTQVPAVPSAVRMAEYVIPKMAHIAPGSTPTTEQLKTVASIVVGLVTALSAVADNVAAFLFGKSVLLKFFEQTFGKAYMDAHPDMTHKAVATCITIAQNAGAITKLGSPTNFAQQKFAVVLDNNGPQGMSIDRVDLQIPDTVKNSHAYIWNAIAGMTGTALLHSLIEDAAKEQAAAPRAMTRKGLFDVLRRA